MTLPDDAGSVLMLSYQMMFDRQLFEQVYRSMLTCGDAGTCDRRGFAGPLCQLSRAYV